MKVTATYSPDGQAVRLMGNRSNAGVVVSADVCRALGGEQEAYFEVKRLNDFLPRQGGEARPLTARDISLARDNMRRGVRYWRYWSLTGPHVRRATGYDSVWGYGHCEGDSVVIYEGQQRRFVVPVGVR